MTIIKRLEQLEEMAAQSLQYQWALCRVEARNISKIVERFGIEGLALEQGLPCTDDFKQEVEQFLSILQGDTEEQAQQGDVMLLEVLALRGEGPLKAYDEAMQRLVDCGLIESVEEDVF